MTYTTSIRYSPTYSISKDGDDISGRFVDRLISLKVCSFEGNGEVDTIDIEVDDRGWNIAEPSIGEGSATLDVSLGYCGPMGVMYQMGTFQVDEVHFKWMPRTMVIHGNSAGANTSLKAPIINAYEGKTLGDIVGQIASSAGVTASVDPSMASIQVPYLNQHSSLGHLLAELERRFNGLAKFSDGKLSFTQRGTGLTASGQALPSVTLEPEDVHTGDIKSNNYFAYSKVRASYLDRTKNQLVWLESNTKGSPNSTVPYLFDQPFGSQAEAQAAADAHMARLNRSTKEGTVTLSKGCPELRGGSKMVLSGFRSGIDDEYMIRCATHTFTKDGGIGTVLDVYTEDGASAADNSSSTGDAPTTAPSLSEMAPEPSTTPVEGATGTLGHE